MRLALPVRAWRPERERERESRPGVLSIAVFTGSLVTVVAPLRVAG